MSREWAFERIEQLICDEKRLITYKIFSCDLKIHVNQAKQYLLEYFQDHSKEDYDAYFFLAGYQEDSAGVQSFKLCLVSHENLEKAKAGFKSVTSCHIYSLNKGKLLDENALYNINQDENLFDNEHKFSSIKHPSVKVQPRVVSKASVKEHATSNGVAKVPKKEEPKQPQKKSGITTMFQKSESKDEKTKSASAEIPNEKDSPKVEANKNQKVSPKVEANKNKKVSPQEKSSKGNALLSMWQKKEEKSQKVVPKKTTKEKKSPQGTSNNLMKMFSKQSEKQAANVNSAPKKISPKKQETETPRSKSIQKESPEKKKKNVTMNSKPVKQKKKSNQKEPSKRTKPTFDSDSDDEFQPQKKKHRRIMTFDDSDSESECEEKLDKAQRDICDPESPLGSSVPMEVDDDEDPIPPTPVSIKKVNQLSVRASPAPKGKSKILKTVVKTYEDEEGFLVTKKEKELVSASEESDGEDPLSSKTEKVIKEDTSKISFFSKKQASLTSFFKQK